MLAVAIAKLLLALVVLFVWFRTGVEGSRVEISFTTWDIKYYLQLAQNGYVSGSPLCAFYPLWPGILFLAGRLTGGHLLMASFGLCNVLSFIAFLLFYHLVERQHGKRVALDALILLLAAPGAFFFSFPYTEALYLVLVLAFFWGLECDARLLLCIAGFLLPLARPVGVFIEVPLAWHLFRSRAPQARWLLMLAPLLGYTCYFTFMHLATGNALEGFVAQRSYPLSPSIRNIFNVPALLNAIIGIRTWDGMTDSAVDRGCFFLFLVLLPFIFRGNRTWFWYTLPTGLIPALTSYFMSYRRYVMVCFPMFVISALILTKNGRRWYFWCCVVLLAVVQILAVLRFVNADWAG
jgi:hypothetical protein